MPKFSYIVLNKEGKKETGSIEASSSFAAGHSLKEQGLTPVEIKEVVLTSKGIAFLQNLQGVKLAEKIVFIEDLSIMLKSGIPVARSMKIIAQQTKNKRFQKVLFDICQGVESGKTLGETMGKYPNIFSDIFVSMIKVGELSGNLDQSLQYLSLQLEREADLRSHVRGAMIYPCVIIAAMVLVGIAMSIFVLPKLTSVFKDFNTQLPLSTRIVIAISDFMAGHAILVIFGIVGLVFAFIFGLRTDPGKRAFYQILLRFPIINPIVKKINLARFARVFSSLLKSGIPIVEGLEVAGDSIPNLLYRDVLSKSAVEVKAGKSLTETLSGQEVLFPFIVVQMLQVGEETGSLENILEQIANHFEAEVDATMKNLSSIIEPLLLLFIGGVVGVLALALITPIYNIGSSVQ